MVLLMSVIVKAKNLTNKTHNVNKGLDIEHAYEKSTATSNVLVIALSLWFITLTSLMVYFTGVTALPAIIVMIIGSGVVFVSNAILTPVMYTVIHDQRKAKRMNRIDRDINLSKNLDVDEEYIEGINKHENEQN